MKANVTWATFDHPHVLPLLGVAYDYDGVERHALIAPWMENGTVMDYVRSHPQADRLKLVS